MKDGMTEYKVVTIRPLPLVIRFSPVLLLAAVHCGRGGWPTNDECLSRALQYGFSLRHFSSHFYCLFTHIFVHFSNEHFLANCAALVCGLLEFREKKWALSGAGFFEVDPNENDDKRDSWGLFASCQTALSALLVMLTAGPIGGVGGQLLYAHLRREGGAAAVLRGKYHDLRHALQQLPWLGSCLCPSSPSASSTAAAVGSALGKGYERISYVLSGAFWRGCVYSGTAGIHRMVHRTTVMCGASAAVCGLAGFNAVYFHNPLCTMVMVLPELILLLQEAVNNALASGWESQIEVLKSLMPRQTIAHAAHLGGFLVGASIGWVLHRLLKPRGRPLQIPEASKIMYLYRFTL